MKRFLTYINDNALVTEGLSDVLFHLTNVVAALTILKSDKFLLTLSLGTSSDDSFRGRKSKLYFLSTARTPTSSYFDFYGDVGLYFELDGRKLSHKYSGKSVDYWSSGSFDRNKSESEDRLYNDKSTIPNASSYIKAIHIYWDVEKTSVQSNDYSMKALRKIDIEAKKKKIPIYFYDDKSNWRTRNIRKAFNPLERGAFDSTVPDPVNKYAGRKETNKWLDAWVELVYTPVQNEARLSDDASRILYRLRYDVGRSLQDLELGLQADIHNRKTRGRADFFVKAMKSLRATSTTEFIKKLKEKWKKSRFVNESLSTPYSFEWGKATIKWGLEAAKFETDDGRKVEVTFENQPGKGVRVDFAVDGHEDVTGLGDAFRIFSTIMDAVKKFIKMKKPNWVAFGTIDAPESRKKLYRRLALRQKTDWHVWDATPGGSHHFVIIVPRKFTKQQAYDIVVGAAGMNVKELTK